jgi:hypothetical protein
MLLYSAYLLTAFLWSFIDCINDNNLQSILALSSSADSVGEYGESSNFLIKKTSADAYTVRVIYNNNFNYIQIIPYLFVYIYIYIHIYS